VFERIYSSGEGNRQNRKSLSLRLL